MKYTVKAILQIVLAAFFWGVFLFFQYVVCFDFFDTNLWYLYLLALLFAFIQYALIVFITKQYSCKYILWACGSIYVSLSIIKLFQLLLRSGYEYHKGLSIVCLLLSFLGSLITYFCLRKFCGRMAS